MADRWILWVWFWLSVCNPRWHCSSTSWNPQSPASTNWWAPPNELSINIIKIIETWQFWPWFFDGSSEVTGAAERVQAFGAVYAVTRVMWQCDAGSHDSDGCAWLSWIGSVRRQKFEKDWILTGMKVQSICWDFGKEREEGVEVTSGLCLT